MSDKLEVWKNNAAGFRWYKNHDRTGKESSGIVQGGRTFTITPFDRQVNQDMAANPDLDMFRNGTFTLVKAAEDTNEDEIQSPDALTEGEVLALSMDISASPESADHFLKGVNSPMALNRVLEQLVVDDAPKDAIQYVKDKIAKNDPSVRVQAERKVVTEAPAEEEIVTPRGGIPEADTPKMVMTEPEKVKE
jgi:hypothetical protein